MSNYTKATNFATKDTLPTGDSGKIVKGTEIDSEFNAIASAISSKADTASPTFTGTPAAPTASSGTNTTQLATTAFVKSAVDTATGSLGTMSTQNKTAVDITGGTVVGITDLAVADGGTGVSTIAANAVVLGNGTSAIQTVVPSTSGNVLTSNGTTWTSATPSLGVGQGQTWQSVTRTSGTTYTNSTGKPIALHVYIATGGTTAYGSTTISINGGSGIILAICYRDVGTGFFIIPDGATYVLTDSGLSSRTTNELR
jgi:hypothetical protein